MFFVNYKKKKFLYHKNGLTNYYFHYFCMLLV